MTLSKLLPLLQERGVRVWVEDAKLRYSAPVGALTPELKSALIEHKETLLSILASPRAPIPRAPRDGPLPLSFAQQRLWLLEQLEPGSARYNIPAAVRLRGRLDVEALRRTFEELVRRHETLRTTFSTVDGEPRQTIEPPARWALPVVTLTDPTTRDLEVQRLALEEAKRPFSLETGPLLRTTLLRLDERDHVLLFTMHHIASDGWSEGVLIDELVALYTAYREGRPSPLPEPALQYADFAVWQRSPEQERVLARQTEYWKNKLRATAPLELPTDRRRPAVQTSRGALVTRKLSAELSSAIRGVGRSHDATLFMTLLAAFDVVLSRYSGQSDICVGTPIANRTREETEPLIGFFVNTLVIRVDMSGAPTFLDVLARVREASLAAYAHQDVPFERLVAELQPDRDLSRSPLFQVMFVLDNRPEKPLQLPGLSLSRVDVPPHVAKFDLSLSIADEPDGLACGVEYNVDLFDVRTIDALVDHFEVVLRGVADRPEARVAELPLCGEAERQRLLVECNDTRRAYTEDALVHQLFERQVERSPRAIAVQHGEASVTYDELNRRANKLAHHLRALGVGTEVLVGVCLERSVDMIVALLAVLKAGGAYVPLDPQYPRERLALIASDARLSLVIDAQVLLDVEAGGSRDENDLPPLHQASLSCAYVIYTSGSTGTPKGVAITHRSAVAFLHWARRAFRREELAGVLAVTSICFDLSVFELFAPLSSGGTVILVRDALDVDAIRSLERRITLVNTVPSVMREWLRSGSLPTTATVVNLAGEPLTRELASKVYEVPTVSRLLNLYGPTEDTTYSTVSEVPRDDTRAPAIGVPIDNRAAYVLDAGLELVPFGVVGELWLAGDGLARGYVGNPAMTAARFRPDPFSAEGGRRMYRTGDLARRRRDGTLECLGRVDFQVKVRGFRIELPEIEATLLTHPSVRDAVVIARDDAHGEKQLVAYYVAAQGESAAAETLRDHLAASLPKHMVPAAFVRLDALPTNERGKLDRTALPKPDTAAYASAPFEAPRGELEASLAEIWAGVLLDLGDRKIGRDDDFFTLGGHSLLAQRVVSRIRDRLAATIPLRAIFEAPTIARLAETLRVAGRTNANGIPLADRSQRLRLSSAQSRLWFLDQLDPGSAAYNLPVALRLDGALDVEALRRALGEIVERHEVLRTTFAIDDGGEPFAVVHPPTAWPLPVHDLSAVAVEDQEGELARLAAEEARRPFTLDRGPLLRTSLLRVARGDHLLLVTMHHIISDGWSMGIFSHELGALYAAFARGERSPLPVLAIQYADFAAWQRAANDGAELERHLTYWRSQLGDPAPLDLPTDRPRGSELRARGATSSFSIDAACAEALRRLARTEGATLFMTLLAGFKALLSRYTRQEDIAVGTPIANRTRSEVEPLIGCFVNTLVLRTDLSGERVTFREALARVKAIALDAYAHQDAPFERVVEAVAPSRDQSRTPLFQVMFALHNASADTPSFAGLTVSRAHVTGDLPVQFELVLDVSEAKDGSLDCALSYSTDLHDPSTIARMGAHYRTLLACALETPDTALSELALTTEDERRRVLAESIGPAAAFRTDARVHDLFEQKARETPHAVAVEMGDRRWSYGELDAHANAIAAHLSKIGVTEGARVALSIERSLEMLAALFGILKAGAAYVPIDPKLPPERKAWMVEDAKVHAIVVRGEAPAFFRGGAPLPVVDARAEPCAKSVERARDKSPAECAAYLLYTSGSTGRPKGVLVSHKNLVHHATAMARRFELSPRDRVLQFASLGFDVAAEEIFPTLAAGATLVLRGGDAELSHDSLTQLEATVLNLPTAYFHAWTDEMQERGVRVPSSVRLVVIGSEAAQNERLARWMKLGGDRVRFINAYGPTEATISATTFAIAPGERFEPRGAWVPIGRPIENVTTYVLDARREPLPAGVPGELWIGGEGVALGYFERPELTRERFVENPFGSGRLYRTGDLVRWSPDGLLEFLGRADSQVKIRGHRVELGEIEAVLRTDAAVREAIVVAREVAEGERSLVAYVVPHTANADRAAELSTNLKAHLARQLPSHLVPPDIVVLDALPLTPNHKVDRRALPAPGRSAGMTSPRDALELDLVAIWEELLGRRPIGIRDSFFDLGGHSLLAVRLMAKIRARTGIDLALATLFERPTIEDLARLLRRAPAHREASGGRTLVRVKPDGSRAPLYCVHPAGGNVLSFARLARALDQDQPLYAFQSAGLVRGGALDDTIEKMASRYVAELREHQARGPYHLLGYSIGGTIAYAMAATLLASGEAVSLTLLDAAAPSRLASDEESVLADFAREHGVRIDEQELRALGEEAALGTVVRAALAAEVLPDDIDESTIRRLLEVMTVNVRAACAYRPQRAGLRALLIRAAGSGVGSAHDVDASLGWEDFVERGMLTIHWASGDHTSLLEEPHIADVARLVSAHLASAHVGDPLAYPPIVGSVSSKAR